MTEFRPSDREVNRVIRSWLREDRQEDVSRIAGVVLDQLDATPQRRTTWWPTRRTPDMNKYLAIGLAAAAVVVIAIIAFNLLPGSPPPGGEPPESVAPSQAPSEPAPSAWAGIPAGPLEVAASDAPVLVTVEITSPGWAHPDPDFLFKDDDGLDPPESVGAALLVWSWPAGTGFNVYGDPCHWTTTIPATPATTPDEIAEAFASQAETDAAPTDVTVGGYAGKAVTLTVPMSYYLDEDATREEEFAACDQSIFAFYGTEDDETVDARNAQGPGQIDALWILDVGGSIVILDAAYSPATPADLVAELRAIAESATFEAP